MFIEHVYQSNPLIHKPLLFTLENNEEQRWFREILNVNPQIEVLDTLTAQIKELIKLKNPSKKLTEDEYWVEINIYLNEKKSDLIGNWCYYPWSKKLIHLLPETDFITVRTNRNLLKITPEEQALLREKKVGIIGLSVGQSVALTLVMERICGCIKLADFDELDLSNLNRLRSGIHNIGIKKTIIAAREIAEIDPYINVEIYSEGVKDENMESFFNDLDLLVEVCDSIDIKIKSRLKARQMKIPVVMDTNDRGMIDIERFDLEPNRAILHGLVTEKELDNINNLEADQKLSLVKKIVAFENTSDRLKKSMNEIGKTISTWPQLASSVMIGAGSCADCCRRIFLNQHTNSGRYYIDTLLMIN
jgi:molybdopterin/thiamine biosynthesis adenylyltransferase